jgi:hypothetical protein
MVTLMKASAWELLNMPVDEAINLFDRLYRLLNNNREYIFSKKKASFYFL